MRKLKKMMVLGLVVAMTATSVTPALASTTNGVAVQQGVKSEINENAKEKLHNLIQEGKKLVGDDETSTVSWAKDVKSFNETYKTGKHGEINYFCNRIVNGKNGKNIIERLMAYLLNEYYDSEFDKNTGISEIVKAEGDNIDTDETMNRVYTYLYVIKVYDYIETTVTSLHDELENLCMGILGNDELMAEKVVKFNVDINIIKNEKVTDTILDGIYISSSPRTNYVNGEKFDPTGMKVTGVFKVIFDGERTALEYREMTNYSYPTEPLKKGDSPIKKITISAAHNGKTVSCPLSLYIEDKEEITTNEVTKKNEVTTEKESETKTVTKEENKKSAKKCISPVVMFVGNSKTVYGIAPKNTKVKAKIGKKTYTTKVSKLGVFKINLKKKLNKNQKITLWTVKKGYKNSKKVVWRIR